MKAEELRLGNYVVSLINGFEYVVDIEILQRISKKQYFPYSVYQYEYIPLTEEWLLKFGFEYLKQYDSWVINNRQNDKEFIIRKDFVVCDMDFKPEVKYVHQLQNLYFSLTGQELIIKK